MKDDLIDTTRELIRNCVLVINRRGIVSADVETLEPHLGTANRARNPMAVHNTAVDAQGADSAFAQAAAIVSN